MRPKLNARRHLRLLWGAQGIADEVGAALRALQEHAALATHARVSDEVDSNTVLARPLLSLDGIRMRVSGTSDRSVIDRSTVLSFQQQGAEVQCHYAGGAVTDGVGFGILTHDRMQFTYVQRDVDGGVDAGESEVDIFRLDDGRLGMRERYHWFTRQGAGVNLFEEIAPIT